ncbi:NUDIX domain-containing protein [Candidatus Odyssella thessalonicensis]|uniref:NUDIX domain-containing protein n=1 Tax=Candidatus Odyssella thessalonicensis TaxID=84647 RepID=UPI000225A961|nr:NUDIX hydrolase [Candidatus Odyssella thessalonicensis]
MLRNNSMNSIAKVVAIAINCSALSSCSVFQEDKPQENVGRPVLTTAGVVHVCPENKIALIERGKAPKGLAMFGGHVEYESPQQAFKREAQEELTITEINNLKLIGVHGDPGRDPRQHSVEITFACTTPQQPKAASDAKKVILYTPKQLQEQLESLDFAFDHKAILKSYLKSLSACNPCRQACSVGIPQDKASPR